MVTPHPLRLHPKQDLKNALLEWSQAQSSSAAFVVSCCGSLQKLRLRLADSNESLEKNEKFEILSLQGTLTPQGVHLHISVADSKGQTWGGHLLEGCEIYTTAEVLVLELSDWKLTRMQDPETGFAELVVTKK